MSIIVILIGSFGLDILSSQTSFSRTLEIQSEINQTFKEIIPEIRSMEESENGAYPIISASSDSFEFYSDVDSNGTVDKVRYFVDGSEMKRGTTKPSGNPPVYDPSDEKIKRLISDLTLTSAGMFKYYDKNFTGSENSLAVPVSIPAIRLIRIEAIVDPKIPGSSNFVSSMQATPRNLR